jgi:hypothetical protein
LQLGRCLERLGISLIGLELVRHAELLAEPDDAFRLTALEVMNNEHDDVLKQEGV